MHKRLECNSVIYSILNGTFCNMSTFTFGALSLLDANTFVLPLNAVLSLVTEY